MIVDHLYPDIFAHYNRGLLKHQREQDAKEVEMREGALVSSPASILSEALAAALQCIPSSVSEAMAS